MNLADVFTVVLLIVGLLTVFVGWWLAIAGLFPQFVERCADKLGAKPGRCWVVGFFSGGPLFVGILVLGKIAANAPGKLFSVVCLFTILLLALAGTAGLALRIGRGLVPVAARTDIGHCVRRGGIVLALTYGTVVLLPFTLLAGFGALALVGLARREIPPTMDP